MKRAQIAIEFVMLAGMAFLIMVAIIISTATISAEKADEVAYFEIRDFGSSIQRELILATEMQDGYNRIVSLPETINGREYELIEGSTEETGYILIEYKGIELFYTTPKLIGSFEKGENRIHKQNETIHINP